MVVAHITADLPNARAALRETPGASLTHVDDAGDADPWTFRYWGQAATLSALERALADDPTVASFARLGQPTADRRLYRLTFDETAMDGIEVYETAIEHDGVILDAVGTGDGWALELFFPDRSGLAAYYDSCREHDIETTVHSVSDRAFPAGEDYGLTSEQREAIRWAAEAGYFDVPRSTSLLDLAEANDISDQALSERLRRGLGRLVENTVLAEADEE